MRQQHAEDLEFNLDLLSATFSSLPEEALQLTAQFMLLPRLFSTLVTLSLCQRVRFFTARRYASEERGICYGPVSVCLPVRLSILHKSVF